MSEYSKDKIYFLKIRKDFFQSHEMRILEGMDGGERYELLYLKLMLESASHNGYLRFSKDIPYTPKMIASLTNMDIDTVMVALKALENLGLVTSTSEGSIFIPKVPELTGITTEGAEKKQIQRRGQQVDNWRTKGGQVADICPPAEKDKIPIGIQDQRQSGQNVDICPQDKRLQTLDSRYLDSREKEFSKNQYEQVRNNELLGMMVQIGFLNESETEDPCWEKFLKDFIQERQDVLGDKDGYVDAKIKLKYVLGSISTVSKGPLDRNGKQIFIRKVDPIIMATIGAKFPWFIKAMKRAVEQQEATLRMAEEYEGFLDNASDGEGEQQ